MAPHAGSLTQEYLAAVIDVYYGLWGAWTDGPGGMWGLYAAKTRADLPSVDPTAAALVPTFFNSDLTYMAMLDPSLEGTFSMTFQVWCA